MAVNSEAAVPVPAGRSSARWPYRVVAVESVSGPLAVDDHHVLLDRGIELRIFADAPAALLGLRDEDPSAVLLPTDLAGAGLRHVVAAVRAWIDVPVIIGLPGTGDGSSAAFDALDAGAIGLVGLPFDADQFASAVRHVGLDNTAAAVLRYGCLELDRQGHRVRVCGASVQLSLREFALLEVLMMRAPHVVSVAELAVTIGMEGHVSDGSAIRKSVQHLRQRLGSVHQQGADMIETVRGLGYRATEPGA